MVMRDSDGVVIYTEELGNYACGWVTWEYWWASCRLADDEESIPVLAMGFPYSQTLFV